jgi:hypothetical protein
LSRLFPPAAGTGPPRSPQSFCKKYRLAPKSQNRAQQRRGSGEQKKRRKKKKGEKRHKHESLKDHGPGPAFRQLPNSRSPSFKTAREASNRKEKNGEKKKKKKKKKKKIKKKNI